MALEFVLMVTRGKNILEVTEGEFTHLRSKVACCMTLLISHFEPQTPTPAELRPGDSVDYISARPMLTAMVSDFAQVQSLMETSNEKTLADETEHECVQSDPFELRHCQRFQKVEEIETRMRSRLVESRLVGRVLDGQGVEDATIIQLLASSSSNISIRWQQGKFIGSGTFGSVHVAINLDTGDLMAVGGGGTLYMLWWEF